MNEKEKARKFFGKVFSKNRVNKAALAAQEVGNIAVGTTKILGENLSMGLLSLSKKLEEISK